MIITVKQAAKILNVSPQRISVLLRSGRIGDPAVGIDYDAVKKYAENRRVGRPTGSYKTKTDE